MASKVVEERELIQANILKLYGDLVSLCKHQLCENCQNYQTLQQVFKVNETGIKCCSKDLLPVTTRGEQCPDYTAN